MLGVFQEGRRKQYFRVRGCPGRAAQLLQAEQTFALQLTFSSEVPVILAVLQPAWTLPFSKAIALSEELLLFPQVVGKHLTVLSVLRQLTLFPPFCFSLKV